MVRGEIPFAARGYIGLRRRERADVGALLASCIGIPGWSEIDIAELARGLALPPRAAREAARPSQGVKVLGPRSLRVELEVGPAVLSRSAPPTGRWSRARAGAERAHEAAHRLRLAGLAVARVLGLAWPARPSGGPSLLVTEWVEGPTLAATLARGGLEASAERRRIARRVGLGIGRLHAAGWVHGDLHPRHLVLLGDEPVFLGLERARPKTRARDRAGDLVGLEMALAEAGGSPLDRGHFLSAYAKTSPAGRSRQRALLVAVRRAIPLAAVAS